MIKIIKKGTLKVTKCTNCGCEFSYEDDDIQDHLATERFDNSYKYIVCPQCTMEIPICSRK